MGAVVQRPLLEPDEFSFSLIQCRPEHLDLHGARSVARLLDAGFVEEPLDWFYDAQVNDRGHVRRLRLDGVRVRVADLAGRPLDAAAQLHLLVWSIGFAVYRLSVPGAGVDAPRQRGFDWYRDLHLLLHEVDDGPDITWRVRVRDDECEVTGNVRRFFDWAGLYVHEAAAGRLCGPGELADWVSTQATGLARNRRLVSAGELRYPYPVEFCSHLELTWRQGERVPGRTEEWLAELVGSGEPGRREVCRIDDRSDESSVWLLGEFQSVRASFAPTDRYPVEMLEYLALRRGALRNIQLATQRLIAERTPVNRVDVADWLWLLSAVTDDYVLAGWQAAAFERIRRRIRTSESIRDVFDLEEQVRRNVESFQGRLDAERDRAGVAIAVLFGIVAATALVPAMQVAAGWLLGMSGGTGGFADLHPRGYLVLNALLLGATGFVSWLMLRNVRWLRPPGQAPVTRLRRRVRRALRAARRRIGAGR